MRPNITRIVRLALGLIALVLLLRVRAILPPFVLAGILTYALEPPVRYLKIHGFRRAQAVILIYVLAFLASAVVLLGFLPRIATEFNKFLEALPEIIRGYRNTVDRIAARYETAGIPEGMRSIVDEGIMAVEVSALAFVRSGIDSLVRIAQGAFEFLLSPVIAFYLLRDFDDFRSEFLRFIPGGAGGKWTRLLRKVDRAMSSFIRGQALLAVIVGLLVTSVAVLMNLRFALLLGVVAFVGEFIPYFGPFFAAIPAVLSALSISSARAIQVVVLFAVIQQLESVVLAPRVIGESVGLHPIAVVFVLLAGGHLAGLWGVFFAVPLFVVLRIVASFVYIEYLSQE